MEEKKLPEGNSEERYNWYELHWRNKEELLEWAGNLSNSYRKYYPHLLEKHCCFHCGAIPCPYNHEEEKQLRLTDMEFVKDLLNDRNSFKLQFENIQKEMADFYERSRLWREEKKELEFAAKELQRCRYEFIQDKQKLESEIARLRNSYMEQKKINYKLRQCEIERDQLKKEITIMKEENCQLKKDNKEVRLLLIRRDNDCEELRKNNDTLTNVLSEKDNELKACQSRFSGFEEKIKSLKQSLSDRDDQTSQLRKEIQTVIEDITQRTTQFNKDIHDKECLIENFRKAMDEIKDELDESKYQNLKDEERLKLLILENQRLKEQLKNDNRFKKYIQVKRQLIDLRNRNDTFLEKNLKTECTLNVLRPKSANCKLYISRNLLKDVANKK